MTRKPIPVDVLRQAATMRRSSLYVWMMSNHDTFKAVVEEAVRPDWQGLADTFGAQGLRDGDDKPPSSEGTRQTWWRVRKAMAARRATAAKRAAARSEPSKPSTQPNRKQVTDVQHNRATGFAHNSTVKVDPDEWGPVKK